MSQYRELSSYVERETTLIILFNFLDIVMSSFLYLFVSFSADHRLRLYCWKLVIRTIVFKWSIQLKIILLARFRHADFTSEKITFYRLLLSTFPQHPSIDNLSMKCLWKVIFMIWYITSVLAPHHFTHVLG